MGGRGRNTFTERSKHRLNHAFDVNQQTYNALYNLYMCFNDEGKVDDLGIVRLSTALANAEEVLGMRRIKR